MDDDLRWVATKQIHELSELTPKHDPTFMRLMRDALEGRLPVYFAAIPLGLCVPFDLDYRPDLHPIGRMAIQQEYERARQKTPHPMIVYARGAWFIVSDDYIALFAALRGSPEYVPCWVMGKPDSDYVRDIQGAVEAKAVRRMFGVAG